MTSTVELFTLRLWRETTGGGKTEWRGKIQHVRSGEARYFRDWRTLVYFLLQVLPKLEDSSSGLGKSSGGGHQGSTRKLGLRGRQPRTTKRRGKGLDALDLFASLRQEDARDPRPSSWMESLVVWVYSCTRASPHAACDRGGVLMEASSRFWDLSLSGIDWLVQPLATAILLALVTEPAWVPVTE